MLLLDPTVQDSIVQSVELGEPLDVAATRAGVHPSNLHEWLAIMREQRTTWHNGVQISPKALAAFSTFSQRIALARANRIAKHVENIRNWRNFKGDSDWRADAWLLERSPDSKRDWSQYREQYTTVEQVAPTREQRYVEQLVQTGGYEALVKAEQELLALPLAEDAGGRSATPAPARIRDLCEESGASGVREE